MTTFKYLEDTYLFESTATFLEIRENDKWKAIILDQTIFYPQWWWQPADQGKIYSDNGTFIVQDVRLDEEWVIWHFGDFESWDFKKWESVSLEIDKERRVTLSKLHSAGHLLDCAVWKLSIENLVPKKWFHFPQWPYIEYEWIIENASELIPDIEKTVNELINENLKLEIKDLSPEEAKESWVFAPPWKWARIVNFSWFPECGCWWTHVNSTWEIGKIEVRKIKSKKGKTSIAYSVL